MLVVGLTGGIGSGKSLAGQFFEALGVPLIDADIIARDLLMPNELAFTQVVATFGSEYLSDDGLLDRAKIRGTIFSDQRRRQQLENILHPAIYNKMARLLSVIRTDNYVMLVVPLLIETRFKDLVQRILVIDTSEANQLARVMLRDKQSSTTIKQIFATQLDRKTRLAAADDVISNNASIADLRALVETQHQIYQSLSNSR